MIKPTSNMSVVASSPARADKLPAPPFSRLLKANIGCRSWISSSSSTHHHSRASPMFVARRRSGSSEVEAVKEDPVSPKVTCMGQVRIHKNNNNPNNNNDAALPLPTNQYQDHNTSVNTETRNAHKHPHHCCCFHPVDLCGPFTCRPRTKRSRVASNTHSPRPWLWPAWLCSTPDLKDQNHLLPSQSVTRARPRVSFACSPVRRDWMTKVAADAHAAQPKQDDDDDAAGSGANLDLPPSTPPKNALLLMRCRSAPQGASSPFTRRFPTPGQPLHPAPATEGSPDQHHPPFASPFIRFNLEDNQPTGADASTACGPNNHLQENPPSPQHHDGDSSTDEDGDDAADLHAPALGPSPSFSSVPLILTRCKSEPAHKTAANLASAPPDSSHVLPTNAAANLDCCRDGKANLLLPCHRH